MEGYRNFRLEHLLLALLFLGSVFLYGILPSLGLSIFGSPDETAVFSVTQQFASGSTASISDPLAASYPWLHPRSWITRGSAIAPVGFLGWPWILSLIAWVLPFAIHWFATLVIASAVIPLWYLLRRYPLPARFLGALVYATYPVLILYGNRSLFPNGALLALGLWVLWFIYFQARVRSEPGKSWQFVALGLLAGLCLSIRPVEGVWLIPWWLWAFWPLIKNKRVLSCLSIGALIALLPILFQAQLAYGGFWKSGYNLRDNPPTIDVIQVSEVSTEAAVQASSRSLLPYGFHPLAIARNTLYFFGQFLFPWTILLLGGIIFTLWPLIKFRRKPDPLILILAWTLVFLFTVYGSGLYADHVRPGAVTMGNSFLRYLLPVAPLLAWCAAEWWLLASQKRNARIAVTVFLVLLSAFGIYTGLARDDESVLALRRELLRYEEIRQAAGTYFQSSDLIVSDRSDKIFFPVFRAASPVPPLSELGRLSREQGISLGLFTRALNQADRDGWRKVGLDPVELESFGRERLYLLRPVLQP